MLETDWVIKAEFQIEAIRKAAQDELQAIKHEFAHWPEEDARRAVIMRFAATLFPPVVSLYTMRMHMHDPAWWEQYAPGTGRDLADPGRTAFSRGVKSVLIIELLGNLEHSFRLILNQLDPANRAWKFSTICQSLFRTSNPRLRNVPVGWEPTVQLLRLMRNTIHTSWAYSPESGKNCTITFNNIKYEFIVGKSLDFVSWDLLGAISDSVLKIAVGVVRDPNVVALPAVKDFGVGQALSAAHPTTP